MNYNDFKDFDPNLAKEMQTNRPMEGAGSQYSNVQVVRTVKAPKKKSSFGKTFSLLLACGLVSGTAGVGGAMLYQEYLRETGQSTQILYTTPTQQATKVASSSGDTAISLPDLYTMNVNATVGITVSTSTMNLFGQPTSSAASGSGFVISENGYVVTNYHVIEEAVGSEDAIEVKFVNGDSYQATIVGYESDNDLAVLKIDAFGLQAVVFGDSDALVVGETVVAIGNPLGELDFTFTNGIISAKDRLISTGDGYTMNMLQTNTAINPGNSGGPLFDGTGALIGINTAKYAESSSGVTVEGLGFAIPINDVKSMITDIIDNGYVTGKPYLGIQIVDVSSEAQLYGIQAGASVQFVAPDSAAERAGMQINDIIVGVGSVAVDSSSALTAAMNEYRAGDTVVFTVIRNQQSVDLTLTFDEKNEDTTSNNELQTQEETTGNTPNTPEGPNSGNGANGNYGNNNSVEDFIENFFGGNFSGGMMP